MVHKEFIGPLKQAPKRKFLSAEIVEGSIH